MKKRMRLLIGGVIVCMGLAGPGVGLVGTPADAAPVVRGSLKVAPLPAIAKERVVFSGRLPYQRRVKLQVETARGWRTIAAKRSAPRGRFRFAVTAPKQKRQYRVHAGPITVGGVRRPAVTTRTRVLRVVRQSLRQGSLEPEWGRPGSAYQYEGAFYPPRPGRVVLLQQRSGGTWRTIGRTKSDRNGWFRFEKSRGLAPGGTKIRVKAKRWNGAAAVAARARLLHTYDTVLVGASSGGVAEMLDLQISDDAEWVAFTSATKGITPETVGEPDVYPYHVYLQNVSTGELRLLDKDPQGRPSAGVSPDIAISSDGARVAFTTDAILTSAVPSQETGSKIYLYDRATDSIEYLFPVQGTNEVDMSADAEVIAAGFNPIKVWSRDTGDVVSVPLAEMFDLSADGRFVAGSINRYDKSTDATVSNIWVHDLVNGTTQLGSRTADGSAVDDAYGPSISEGGRWLAYHVPNDRVVNGTTVARGTYVVDMQTGQPRYVGASWWNSISDDGDLVTDTENGALVIRDRATLDVIVNTQVYDTFQPHLPRSAGAVAFYSSSRDVDPRATDGKGYGYVYLW